MILRTPSKYLPGSSFFLNYMMDRYLLLFLLSVTINACNKKSTSRFTILPSSETGIDFRNQIDDRTDSSLISEFSFMGGGVGIGDFNNDGLKDIYFTGNQQSSKLYINKGDNKFDDITQQAGVSTDVWATGVNVLDINGDGYDDILVSVWGKDLSHKSHVLLFINQHNLTFQEESAAYGMVDSMITTQIVALDYDHDGDLDLYFCNYRIQGPNANDILPPDTSGLSPASDRLYRNDASTAGHPVFHNVSLSAGIKEGGYGLGVSVCDINNDGWPDIYVANDFLYNDELWLNKKDGTFTNVIGQSTRHQSYSSMGVDVADMNNDGLLEVATVDMMPQTNERKKLAFSFMSQERYDMERSMGYQPEFSRNMLQYNNGLQKYGHDSIPIFSEIGQLSGIAETDWSWSVLFADFDNDGWKDLHVTNGIGRDFINADFAEFIQNSHLNITDKYKRRQATNDFLRSLKHVPLTSYLYRNNKDLTFQDISAGSGIDQAAMSNGAVYVDLDNDGDLDLVVNNINQEAFVIRNNTIDGTPDQNSHFLEINLKGDNNNSSGLGATVQMYAAGMMQKLEENPVRGYLSSVDRTLHFGLGATSKVDSIILRWPDGQIQKLGEASADTILTIAKDGRMIPANKASVADKLFTDITSSWKENYRHIEEPFNDFAYQSLLPQKYSQLGPHIAVGDVNTDQLEDFFIGGAFHYSGSVFRQDRHGVFASTALVNEKKMQEDGSCVLFDIDNDNDLDLIITGGDVPYEQGDPLKPRLYINDGKGHFTIAKGIIPDQVNGISSCVKAADFDGDGDQDLFIGGRISPAYPIPPRSFILQNDHGVYRDVTDSVCPEMKKIGMVTDALWIDYDDDKKMDLIVCGEWMSVRFFRNIKNRLVDETSKTGLQNNEGMWRCLVAADLDGDGDLDLVAGNMGLNNKFDISPQYPMWLFSSDIDDNGKIDPLLFYYINTEQGPRRLFPAVSKNELTNQVPSLKKKFLSNKAYSAANLLSIYNDTAGLKPLVCRETASCYFENIGNGKFKKHLLPLQAQFAPVNTILCDDFNNDSIMDILIAGNEYQVDALTGRYDASYGLFLRGLKALRYEGESPVKSGFLLEGDVRDMKILHNAKKDKMILVGVNNDSMRIFRCNRNRQNP